MRESFIVFWTGQMAANPNNLCPAWREDPEAIARDIDPRPSSRARLMRIDRTRPFGPDNWEWRMPCSSRLPSNRKVKPNELPLLLEMVEAGTPISAVAKAFGITSGGVRNILCRRGIKANQTRREGAQSPCQPKITPDIATAIRTRYVEGESVQDLADEYGLKLRAAYYVISGKTWKREV